jgi:HEAT repeat protein
MVRDSKRSAEVDTPLTGAVRTAPGVCNRDRLGGLDRFRVWAFPTRGRRAGQGFLFLLAASLLLWTGCERTPGERRKAIYDLRDNPSEENVAAIRDYLSDSDRNVRATALNVLVGLEVSDSVELSSTALEDPDGFVRATAAKLLGDTRDAAHAGLLSRRLREDADPIVRLRAAESLGDVGGSEAVEALVGGIEDPDDKVRLAAVEALRELGPAPAFDGLVRLLQHDETWEVRAQAARALGATGDAAAVPVLEAALGDANEFVRSAAQNALRILDAVGQGGAPG